MLCKTLLVVLMYTKGTNAEEWNALDIYKKYLGKTGNADPNEYNEY
jgi:hypothetical protein